jgi:two-component system OmpR family response regulator
VRFTLENGGYQVLEARDGAQALTTFAAKPIDLVVLDIVMPESDGLTVCRTIRAGTKSHVPIMFVSSRDDELDRVLGLEMGADDYMVKPFSPRELLARVKAMLRRTAAQAQPASETKADELVCHGKLTIDVARHRVTWDDTAIVLTVTEFSLLATLARAPGRVLTRDAMVDKAYGEGHVITDRTVDSHIRRVRSKLAAVGADPIETVYGLGYRMREQA